MKILNLIDTTLEYNKSIADGFLVYMPTGMSELGEWEDIERADISLLYSGIMHEQRDCLINSVDRGISDSYWNGLSLNNLESLCGITNVLNDKPRIIFFDMFPRNALDAYPDFVRDTDIPVGTVAMPEHPNAFTTHFIDDRKFFLSYRSERQAKSVGIGSEDLNDTTYTLVMRLLDDNVINRLSIFGDFHMIEILTKYNDRVNIITTENSDKQQELSRLEYTLCLTTNKPHDPIGIEGAFCGVQPIYPHNDFYHTQYPDDLGVKFYDQKNAYAEIKEILKAPIELDTELWKNKFSTSVNMPGFWDHVKNVLQNQKDAE